MATVIENLTTTKSNLAAQLEELSRNPKPNYSVDGKQYSFGDYMKWLVSSMNDIDVAIQSQEGPAEVVIQGYT